MDTYPYTDFFDGLLQEVPGFQPQYRKHLAENGQLLPHVALADLEMWLDDLVRNSRGDPQREPIAQTTVRKVVDYLEYQWGRSPPLRELISVSFLEYLHPPDAIFPVIRPMLGPGLTEELETILDAFGWGSDKEGRTS